MDPGANDRTFSDLELRDRLQKALARLPAETRFLIAAHYFSGRRYEELADVLGVPLGTVKTQLHRAKRRLREAVRGRLPELARGYQLVLVARAAIRDAEFPAVQAAVDSLLARAGLLALPEGDGSAR